MSENGLSETNRQERGRRKQEAAMRARKAGLGRQNLQSAKGITSMKMEIMGEGRRNNRWCLTPSDASPRFLAKWRAGGVSSPSLASSQRKWEAVMASLANAPVAGASQCYGGCEGAVNWLHVLTLRRLQPAEQPRCSGASAPQPHLMSQKTLPIVSEVQLLRLLHSTLKIQMRER